MPAMKVEFDFEVYCERCGAGICNTVSVNNTTIHVPPCSICMAVERSEGYDEGYSEGCDAFK